MKNAAVPMSIPDKKSILEESMSVDGPDALKIPKHLYGRGNILNILQECLRRVGQGSVELALLCGPPGIGKTSLVNELKNNPECGHARIISGKYSKFLDDIPFGAIVRALQTFVDQICAGGEEEKEFWRKRIKKGLGENLAIVARLIPESEKLMGSEPFASFVEPAEAQNRLMVAFKTLVNIIAEKDHPLVLFLDDVQWADMAGMKLIKTILDDSDIKFFFLICAYRDTELTSLDPFSKFLNEFSNGNRKINSIQLTALKSRHICLLLAGVLNRQESECKDLAAVVLEKTAGNPFFVQQFLRSIHGSGRLTFDANGRWSWDLDEIRQCLVTDNVIDLVVERMKKLPSEVLSVLKIAACMGRKFNPINLSAIMGLQNAIILEYLKIVERNNFIEKNGDSFFFVHDRIQEALYLLMPSAEKKVAHRSIGRYFLLRKAKNDSDRKIHYIVNQLNAAIDETSPADEKKELADLNLLAGTMARDSSAFFEAAEYFARGIKLLPSDCWTAAYDLSLKLHLAKSECEYLIDNNEESERLTSLVLKNAATSIDRTMALKINALMNHNQGKFAEAHFLWISALKELGVDLPLHPGKGAIFHEYLKIRFRLAFKRPRDILTLKNMTDPLKQKILSILFASATTAYFADQNYLALAGLKGTFLSLKHGNSPESASCYATFAMVLGFEFGKHKYAYELGQAALELCKRENNPAQICRTKFVLASLINPWMTGIQKSIEDHEEACRIGLKSGEFVYAGYCAGLRLTYMFFVGHPLEKLNDFFIDYFQLMKKINQIDMYVLLKCARQCVLSLRGKTLSFPSLSDEVFDEDIQRNNLTKLKSPFPICLFHLYKLPILYLAGHYGEALKTALYLEEKKQLLYAIYYESDRIFYHSLTLAALYGDAPEREKGDYLKTIKNGKKLLQGWTKSCPENFSQKLALLKAEEARIKGNGKLAEKEYQTAIHEAEQSSFLNLEALSSELFGKHLLAEKKLEKASVYLNKARQLYSRWGAEAKVDQLTEHFKELINHGL